MKCHNEITSTHPRKSHHFRQRTGTRKELPMAHIIPLIILKEGLKLLREALQLRYKTRIIPLLCPYGIQYKGHPSVQWSLITTLAEISGVRYSPQLPGISRKSFSLYILGSLGNLHSVTCSGFRYLDEPKSAAGDKLQALSHQRRLLRVLGWYTVCTCPCRCLQIIQ
jgi:hypothetical protein